MAKKRKPAMLTVKEVAERINASDRAVRLWAKAGRFPGAEFVTDSIVPYWLIPDTALVGFENAGPGRPRKPLSELKGKPRRKD
jgi:hypothetical protein